MCALGDGGGALAVRMSAKVEADRPGLVRLAE